MNRYFLIGDFTFCLHTSDIDTDVLRPPANFLKFEIPGGAPEYTYTLRLTEQLPALPGTSDRTPVAVRPDIQVFQTPHGETRYLGVKGQSQFYACYQETDDRHATIFLDRRRITSLSIDPVFTSLFALEPRMLERESLIFHCAYIQYNGEAILFSAPSETGKTTQANLWEKYEGSRTMNVDKALVRMEPSRRGRLADCSQSKPAGGTWIADGWPVCGTSEVCHNERTPIRAIVMLRQAPDNQVRRLRPSEAFLQIYAQTTINSWSRERVEKSTRLIERLITEIPVYEFGCTISREAVTCLKTVLYP